ncbi:SDR family NAD(P)-dependent oxidoreductase [Ochrovirga pacifica]|uniref:SDR family NAD(P)-dependent oxidoreductase n=1 Tax=Ochrovirga pacifica TaxID=1042376 RepID=UPI000255778C|nr:SDR family oxidoreductase [Ochrovirga pacifica]
MILQGKVAVIAGDASELGREISLKLVQEGAKVVVHYKENQQQAIAIAKEIHNLGGECLMLKADLSKSQEVKDFVEKTISAFGEKIHLLVCMYQDQLVAQKSTLNEDSYNGLMNNQVKSCLFLNQAFKPCLVNGGSIVNFTYEFSEQSPEELILLSTASNAAITSFTERLATQVQSYGIRVNTLHSSGQKKEVTSIKVAKETNSLKWKEHRSISNLIAYLASDSSSYITGNHIDINKGLSYR